MSETRDILKRRQKRALATILAYKEQHIDAQLDPQSRTRLRKVILDEFNDYYNLVLDMLPTGTPPSTVDLKKLAAQVDDLHQAVCPEIPVDPRELGLVDDDLSEQST